MTNLALKLRGTQRSATTGDKMVRYKNHILDRHSASNFRFNLIAAPTIKSENKNENGLS